MLTLNWNNSRRAASWSLLKLVSRSWACSIAALFCSTVRLTGGWSHHWTLVWKDVVKSERVSPSQSNATAPLIWPCFDVNENDEGVADAEGFLEKIQGSSEVVVIEEDGGGIILLSDPTMSSFSSGVTPATTTIPSDHIVISIHTMAAATTTIMIHVFIVIGAISLVVFWGNFRGAHSTMTDLTNSGHSIGGSLWHLICMWASCKARPSHKLLDVFIMGPPWITKVFGLGMFLVIRYQNRCFQAVISLDVTICIIFPSLQRLVSIWPNFFSSCRVSGRIQVTATKVWEAKSRQSWLSKIIVYPLPCEGSVSPNIHLAFSSIVHINKEWRVSLTWMRTSTINSHRKKDTCCWRSHLWSDSARKTCRPTQLDLLVWPTSMTSRHSKLTWCTFQTVLRLSQDSSSGKFLIAKPPRMQGPCNLQYLEWSIIYMIEENRPQSSLTCK